MRITFNLKPFEGKMTVKAEYVNDEIATPHFYLNRDFTITSLVCDGVESDIRAEITGLENHGGYMANKISLPEIKSGLKLEYTGVLTGKTGSCPYVREQINPEFTFLRHETFCYPIFYNDDWDSFNKKCYNSVEIEIITPRGYKAAAVGKSAGIDEDGDEVRYSFIGDDLSNDCINCSVAKYITVETSVGIFYLLKDIGETQNQLTETMKKAHEYMNAHFGQRNIPSDMVYAAIPDGYGSFARQGMVFVQESTFNSVRNLSQIVHEFIHLGWNASVEGITQRARFFDEAFTSYFEMRVMKHITGSDYLFVGAENWYKKIMQDGKFKLVPICEFGKHEYGDLSYSIGALCLRDLCVLVGTETFDSATKEFLEKYKEIPVDFDIFREEYIKLCGKDNEARVRSFLYEWIYTCDGVKKYLS